MSVNGLRKSFENKGCQVLLITISALAAIGLLIPGQCSSVFGQKPGEMPDNSPPVLELGKIKKTSNQYQIVFNTIADQFGANVNTDADFRLRVVSQAARGLLDQAAMDSLLAERGITIDDKTVLSTLEGQMKQQLEQEKQMLPLKGLVKPGASAAELDAALRKEIGGDPADVIKARLDQAASELKDPAKAFKWKMSATNIALLNDEEKKHSVSDDELKKDYDQFTLDQVPFQDSSVPLEERKALAEKALADARAGKSIDEIRKAYAPKEATAPVTPTRAALEYDDQMKSVAALKVGQWSDVVVGPGGPAIYRVAKIEPGLPADFEQNKEKYRESHAQTLAAKALDSAIKEKEKSVKWLSVGIGLAVRYSDETNDPSFRTDTAKHKQILLKLDADAKDVKDTTSVGDEAAALVRNAAAKQLYGLATPDEQKAFAQERVDAMQNVLQYVDSSATRIELIDAAQAVGDNDLSALSLLEAARGLGRPDAASQGDYDKITNLLTSFKQQKKISDDMATKVETELKRWMDDKVQQEKDADELKKLNAERDKEAKEQEDAAKADLEAQRKKDAEEAAKGSTSGKTGAATAGSTGGAKPNEGEKKSDNPVGQFLKPEGATGG